VWRCDKHVQRLWQEILLLVSFITFKLFTHFHHEEVKRPRLEPLEFRASLARREAVLRLDEHLLHAILLLVEGVVHSSQILETHAVRNHLHGCDLLVLDHLEEGLPVFVDGRLAVTDEADAALHERADVEVVGLAGC
jgi:hypothetical protein